MKKQILLSLIFLLAVASKCYSQNNCSWAFNPLENSDPNREISSLTSPADLNNALIGKCSNASYKRVNRIEEKAITAFDQSGRSVKTDKAGNVYVTGNFTGTVDFDPGAGFAKL
ncbi:MAG: hypothetical protein V2A54_06205, partial [Bacteroidota bacterium]